MSEWTLKKGSFVPRQGPLLVVVMDGVGIGKPDEGNAVHLARTPVLDRIWARYPTTSLQAHGTRVGLPSDKDMGNSEVGHNALGAGRVYAQGSKLVKEAIEGGSLFEGEVWRRMTDRCNRLDTPMHFIGLLSDGNVHSHQDQLFALIRGCHEAGVRQVRVHPLLDGRDVPASSALEYIDALEAVLSGVNDAGGAPRDYRIASGGGRMVVTMDRYEANWPVVERGWKAHVLGKGRAFASAREAIETYRREDDEMTDQFLPEFVIAEGGRPVGTIEDGHCVVLFNFRGDRAMQISRAFDQEEFPHFDRERRPDVIFAGLMQYDGDLLIPRTFLVQPPQIERTLGELLAKNAIHQFACSETQKYGHVTYFWNGNRGGKFNEETEEYAEIRSDIVPFEQRPWMKAAQITDATLEALRSGRFPFLRINFPNGDMVGHTGDREATIVAVESVDLCLGRLLNAMEDLGGITLVTADHGNADQMYEIDKKTGEFKKGPDGEVKAKTAHSLNPVPFSIVDPRLDGEYELDPSVESPGLSTVAATALTLMGYEVPGGFDPALIKLR